MDLGDVVKISALLVAFGGFIVSLVKLGEWKAKREADSKALEKASSERFEQEVARDLTRTTVLKLDKGMDMLLVTAARHGEDLAVIKHQTNDHSRRLDNHEEKLGDHDTRLTWVETKLEIKTP